MAFWLKKSAPCHVFPCLSKLLVAAPSKSFSSTPFRNLIVVSILAWRSANDFSVFSNAAMLVRPATEWGCCGQHWWRFELGMSTAAYHLRDGLLWSRTPRSCVPWRRSRLLWGCGRGMLDPWWKRGRWRCREMAFLIRDELIPWGAVYEDGNSAGDCWVKYETEWMGILGFCNREAVQLFISWDGVRRMVNQRQPIRSWIYKLTGSTAALIPISATENL